jgi:hypothetical protein
MGHRSAKVGTSLPLRIALVLNDSFGLQAWQKHLRFLCTWATTPISVSDHTRNMDISSPYAHLLDLPTKFARLSSTKRRSREWVLYHHVRSISINDTLLYIRVESRNSGMICISLSWFVLGLAMLSQDPSAAVCQKSKKWPRSAVRAQQGYFNERIKKPQPWSLPIDAGRVTRGDAITEK